MRENGRARDIEKRRAKYETEIGRGFTWSLGKWRGDWGRVGEG